MDSIFLSIVGGSQKETAILEGIGFNGAAPRWAWKNSPFFTRRPAASRLQGDHAAMRGAPPRCALDDGRDGRRHPLPGDPEEWTRICGKLSQAIRKARGAGSIARAWGVSPRW